MDLKNKKGNPLREFLSIKDLKNYVRDYTRIARSFNENKNKYITSKTLIDVAIHNG